MAEEGETVDTDVSLEEEEDSMPPPAPALPSLVQSADIYTVRKPTMPTPVSSQVRSVILVEVEAFIIRGIYSSIVRILFPRASKGGTIFLPQIFF